MSAERDADDTGALFVDDRELHRRVCPALGWDRFKAVLKVWEREGFPKINSLTRGRFWPGVVKWLHSHYGADEKLGAEQAEDGPEDFSFGRREDATARQSSGPQAGPHSQGRNDTVLL